MEGDNTSTQDVKQTVTDRLKAVETVLNEYLNKVGISALQYNKESEDILKYTQEDIKRLSAEDCGAAAYVLFQYAAYIQKECNRHSVRVIWADKNLSHEIAKRGSQYGSQYTKYEERQQLVISDETNSYIQALNNLKFHAKIRLEELSFISGKIGMMGECLINTQRSKNNAKWNNK